MDNNNTNSAEAGKISISGSSLAKATPEAPNLKAMNEEIQTDIDDLIRIITEKGEISMADAAKALGVPQQTVEAWSIFLEEDGVIEVRYKLTTPYLAIKEYDQNNPSEKKNRSHPETPNTDLKVKGTRPGSTRTDLQSVKMPNLFQEATKEIDNLFTKAYELIEEGKFEEANKIYELIKKGNEAFPTGLNEFKKDVSVNLAKLNKDLIVHIEKYNLKASEELTKYISRKLSRLAHLIQTGEIKEAQDTYTDIQSALSAFPVGFDTRKSDIQAKVIEVYKKLLAKKKVLISKYNTSKILQLKKAIEEIKTALQTNQVQQASEKYDEARQIYGELPEGFAEENEALAKELFSLVPLIIASRKKHFSEEFSDMNTKLHGLIASTYECIRQGKIELAERHYAELKEIYSKLPKDFFNRRVELEAEILELEHQLLLRSKTTSLVMLRDAVASINKLVKMAKSYMNRNNVELAEGVYYELLATYRQIPEGFLEQKTVLGVEILNVFREIMLKYDEEIIKDLDEKTHQNYEKIIQLITTLRGDIEGEKLDVLENKFSEISELFGRLPFRFVQENTKLWREVQLLSSEIDLFKKASAIPGYRGDLTTLNLILEDLRIGYLQIYNQFQEFPDYSKLLVFVKDNYLYYYNLLNRTSLTEIPSDAAVKSVQLPSAVHFGKEFAAERMPKPEPTEEGPVIPPDELARPVFEAPKPEALQVGTIMVTPRIETPSVVAREAGPEALQTPLPDTGMEGQELGQQYSEQDLSVSEVKVEDVEGPVSPNEQPSTYQPNEKPAETQAEKPAEPQPDRPIDKLVQKMAGRLGQQPSGQTATGSEEPNPDKPDSDAIPQKTQRKTGSQRQSRFISDYIPEEKPARIKEITYSNSLPEAPSKTRHPRVYVMPESSDEEPAEPISNKKISSAAPEPMPDEITPSRLKENLITNMIEAGDSRLNLGRFDDAEKAYQQALAFDGFNRVAREKLTRLEKLKTESSSDALKIAELPPHESEEKEKPPIDKATEESDLKNLNSKLESLDRLIKSELVPKTAAKQAPRQKTNLSKNKKAR